MSDSNIVKETLSYRKIRVAETTSSPQIPQVIQFAHKFAGGETSFSLLSLTTPSTEMPGFTNPSPAVLSGTYLSLNQGALRLYTSLNGGRLVPYESFRVLGTTISFLGALSAGVPVGMIVFGEISAAAANPIVVGDGRFIRKSYTLAAGTTTLNLGFTYKVGVNLGSSDQIGDVKVYRNGVLQMRNVGNAAASPSADGNYQEVDAGNGYGTSITFNTPPSGLSDAILVEMGYQIASGQLQIWSELERLQGALQALAADAAVGFGNPITNYLSANATELERRAFGDTVLSQGNRISALEAARPGFSAYMSTSATLSTTTNIPFDQVEYNFGGIYNTTTYTMTANASGRWLFNAVISSASAQTLSTPCFLAVDGARRRDMFEALTFAINTEYHACAILNLTQGQTVSLSHLTGSSFTYQGGASAQNFYSLFQGQYLGA